MAIVSCEMDMKMARIHELTVEKDELEFVAKRTKEKLENIEQMITRLKKELLAIMKDNNFDEYCAHGLVSSIGSKASKGYSKEEEAQIIQILKDNALSNCISVKESLLKRELSKELKSNEELRESLKDFGTEKVSEFVTVMTIENATKQKQIILKKVKSADELSDKVVDKS